MKNRFKMNLRTHTLQSVEKVGLRRSSRLKIPLIPSDYIIYLKGSECDVEPKDDPSSFSEIHE
jgi:phosphomevalonate kinase